MSDELETTTSTTATAADAPTLAPVEHPAEATVEAAPAVAAAPSESATSTVLAAVEDAAELLAPAVLPVAEAALESLSIDVSPALAIVEPLVEAAFTWYSVHEQSQPSPVMLRAHDLVDAVERFKSAKGIHTFHLHQPSVAGPFPDYKPSASELELDDILVAKHGAPPA